MKYYLCHSSLEAYLNQKIFNSGDDRKSLISQMLQASNVTGVLKWYEHFCQR